jgi:cyclomaltodextrinase
MLIGVAVILTAPFVQDGRIQHEFALQLDRPATSVHVAGTFNGWNKTANMLSKSSDGTWRTMVRMTPGKHLYKFVIDNSEWITDPRAKRNEDDGGGNVNSVLMLLPKDYGRPAKAGDGIIAKSALRHSTEVPDLNYDRGQLTLTFRARPGDLSHLEMFVPTSTGEMCVELKEVARDDLYAIYRAKMPWDRASDFKYRFMLVDGATRAYYTPAGLSEAQKSPFILKAKEFKPFVTPSWVEKSVFYQIFPDRFANGDKGNDPRGVESWDATPTYFNRFGGDAAGIRSRISYLRSLGVNAIYFNPIFKSPSNHRYDASDYKLVDPEFGTNAEYFALTKELKAAGIRTMLDFAFNHTAVDFPAFMDIRKNGADSKFRNWYWIKSYPVEVRENPTYEAWFGFPSMPKLNVMNPETHAFVLGVVDFWRENSSLDGLRLDVANEVDMRMWRSLRNHVKSKAPSTYILGEEWGDATKWLKGDQWDASMNYGFRDACLRFFASEDISAGEFARRLMHNFNLYASQVSRVQYNLLSSHDTPRFLTLCGGDKGRALLAATMLFTWPGVPSIYYGEELGMEGGRDPENRRGMEWNKNRPDNAFLARYKKLVSIRRSSAALQSGDPQVLFISDAQQSLAFARVLDKDQAIIVVNRSASPQKLSIPISSDISVRRFVDALTGVSATVVKDRIAFSLAPMSSAILISSGGQSRQAEMNHGLENHHHDPVGGRRNS